MTRSIAVTVGYIEPAWEGVSIAEENALPGDPYSEWEITGAGATSNVGFARGFAVSVGATVQFSCHGNGTVLDIYRLGWYGGDGSRLVTTLTNTATSQPNPSSISSSNGGTTCSNWSVTASWAVPDDAVSGFYLGCYRNAAQSDASWIPFVVYDDARPADIVVKTSDSTWGIAYNSFGTPASPTSGGGRDFYGENYAFDINLRCYAGTWNKPMLTRGPRPQTYWRNGELPLWMWLERNGYSVKYISSRCMDQRSTCLDNAAILICAGHDEYWSQSMRDRAYAFRDAGKHQLHMSGNEVFWRTRQPSADELRCYKDTMPGPTGSGHTAGTALDPVTWTGTWRDTRSANNATRDAENNLTGTYFRMNGINQRNPTFDGQAGYASHPVWRNTSVASGSDVTVNEIVGFEADETAPVRAGAVILAEQTFNIDDNYANDDGETYTNDGDLDWGIVSQRYPSGAVSVGFGTTQWAWGLDNTHDRGSAVANNTVRQFTYNLLRDLGANTATLMAGLTASSPEALTNYGSTAP